MNTELYKALKSVEIKNLTEDDKEELLGIFMITKNSLIRNHIGENSTLHFVEQTQKLLSGKAVRTYNT